MCVCVCECSVHQVIHIENSIKSCPTGYCWQGVGGNHLLWLIYDIAVWLAARFSQCGCLLDPWEDWAVNPCSVLIFDKLEVSRSSSLPGHKSQLHKCVLWPKLFIYALDMLPLNHFIIIWDCHALWSRKIYHTVRQSCIMIQGPVTDVSLHCRCISKLKEVELEGAGDIKILTYCT